MKAYQYREGDIVEVSPGRHEGYLVPPFRGVVDSRNLPRRVRSGWWVFVRQLEPIPHTWPGGWYAEQCRLIIRPPQIPTLPVPDNIELGND